MNKQEIIKNIDGNGGLDEDYIVSNIRSEGLIVDWSTVSDYITHMLREGWGGATGRTRRAVGDHYATKWGYTL